MFNKQLFLLFFISIVILGSSVTKAASFLSPHLARKGCISPHQRVCCKDCRSIHKDWMGKCYQGNVRDFKLCSRFANTALVSCQLSCLAPKKDCYTLRDFSRGL